MRNDKAVLEIGATDLYRPQLELPQVELKQLPAKLSKRLWVSPAEFLEVTSSPVLAQWTIEVNRSWRPSLSGSGRGRKPVYQDWTIMLVALVQVAWMMSYEEVIDYFRAHSQVAQMVGFPEGRVISVGQYWERRRALGILPFWLFFVALVGQLFRLGVVKGTDLILDSTTLKAWFHQDRDAKWSFPKPWKGSIRGYKVHTVLCRWSQLPVIFLVTPANRHDAPWAIPLLTLTLYCYGFSIMIVRADAAYFTTKLMVFIRTVLKASFMIDYNLRRQGKRFLATLFFVEQWRFYMGPRTTIERHFAWAKRYFGLEAGRWFGLVAAYQHTALVYSVMLAVALVAHRYQRPELAGSRSRVLAAKTLS